MPSKVEESPTALPDIEHEDPAAGLPQQEQVQGVFVNVQYDEQGGCSVIGIIPQGTTRPSEITDILLLGIKAHQRSAGIA
jgi:hypothetical protein